MCVCCPKRSPKLGPSFLGTISERTTSTSESTPVQLRLPSEHKAPLPTSVLDPFLTLILQRQGATCALGLVRSSPCFTTQATSFLHHLFTRLVHSLVSLPPPSLHTDVTAGKGRDKASVRQDGNSILDTLSQGNSETCPAPRSLQSRGGAADTHSPENKCSKNAYFLQLQQDTMRSLFSEQSVSVKDEVMEEKNGTGFIHSTNSFLLCHTRYETAAKSKRHFLF